MRIKVVPPNPPPPLPAGALLTVRVEAADPAPLIAGPLSIAYEARWAPEHAPGGAFLFPAAPAGPGGVSTTPAASGFRLPPAVDARPYVDIPLGPGDTVMATLTAGNQTYGAARTIPFDPPAPSALTLVLAAGAAPPPTPGPAEGLTITPHQVDEDVWTLNTAPGADNLVVVN